MKTMTFERFTNKMHRNIIDRLTAEQTIIEATFTDLEIDPYITVTEVHEGLEDILNTYSNFMGDTAEALLCEVLNLLADDDEDDMDDIVFALLTTFLTIDEIKFHIGLPMLKMNEKALENLRSLKEIGIEAFEHVNELSLGDFVTEEPDRLDPIDDIDPNEVEDYEGDEE